MNSRFDGGNCAALRGRDGARRTNKKIQCKARSRPLRIIDFPQWDTVLIRTPFAAVANINSKDCADDEDNEEGSETPPPAVDGFDVEDDVVLAIPTWDKFESTPIAQLK